MVGHGGSSAGSYLADPTSPIPSHCASIVATSTVRVNTIVSFSKSNCIRFNSSCIIRVVLILLESQIYRIFTFFLQQFCVTFWCCEARKQDDFSFSVLHTCKYAILLHRVSFPHHIGFILQSVTWAKLLFNYLAFLLCCISFLIF